MKVTINSVLKIFIGLFIALGVSLGLLYLIFNLGGVFIMFGGEAKKAIQRRDRLLCETDHQTLLELLEACREISRMFADGELKKYQYQVREYPDPEISSFPQVILDLEPTYINLIPKGPVTLELCGGFDHFGVYAFTEDFKPPVSGYHYGDRELIPGLWYYDDGYYNNPEYGKAIEALIQKKKVSN